MYGDLLAIGFPRNSSVSLYRQTHGPRAGGAWIIASVLEGKPAAGFGASLSLGQHILVAGGPDAASSGARVFSVLRSDAGGGAGAAFGAEVFDTSTSCCARGLACCGVKGIGRAVAQLTQGFTVRVMVGDEGRDQVPYNPPTP